MSTKLGFFRNRLWDSLPFWGSVIRVSPTLPIYLGGINSMPLTSPSAGYYLYSWLSLQLNLILVVVFVFIHNLFTEGADLSLWIWYRNTKST